MTNLFHYILPANIYIHL